MAERTDSHPQDRSPTLTEGLWLDVTTGGGQAQEPADVSRMEELSANAAAQGHVFKIPVAARSMLLPRVAISNEVGNAVTQICTKLTSLCRKHGLVVGRYSLYSPGVIEIPLLAVEAVKPRPIDSAGAVPAQEVARRATAAYQSLVDCSRSAAEADIEVAASGAQNEANADANALRPPGCSNNAEPEKVPMPARQPVDSAAQNVLKALGKTGLELRSNTGADALKNLELSKLHRVDSPSGTSSRTVVGEVTSVDPVSGYFIVGGTTPVHPVGKIIWPQVGDTIAADSPSDVGRPKPLQGVFASSVKIQPRLT